MSDDYSCKYVLTMRGTAMEERITGVMIYYYFVCKRKLWYFCHEIRMESDNENVMLGKILDDTSYKRDDKHIDIDGIISIDFIRENHELHEVKKSKAIEEAGIWQTKYSLYYLEKRGVENLHAQIDYPLLRKNRTVELTEEDRKQLDTVIDEIIHIKNQELPGDLQRSKLCYKCAYGDLCLI